jgi:hypothetical protein
MVHPSSDHAHLFLPHLKKELRREELSASGLQGDFPT